MGTTIENLQVTRVTDGDTIRVQLGDKQESIRLAGIDTEESQPASATPDKPVTRAGLAASAMAKAYFTSERGGLARVTLELDTDDPLDDGLSRHRDNYGRLLSYVHKDGENYNVKLVRDGWSPYFVKYGRSRVYHRQLTDAEAQAQAHGRGIWDPATNGGGPSRPYDVLVPWWVSRASIVDEFRALGNPATVLAVRLDYQRLLHAVGSGERVTVLCDLQESPKSVGEDAAVIFAGSQFHKLNLWIPDAAGEDGARVVRLVQTRYAGRGRGYVYVTGAVGSHRGIPEIELTHPGQLSDFPPSG